VLRLAVQKRRCGKVKLDRADSQTEHAQRKFCTRQDRCREQGLSPPKCRAAADVAGSSLQIIRTTPNRNADTCEAAPEYAMGPRPARKIPLPAAPTPGAGEMRELI
jgi:hypothetical protein